MRRLRKEDDVSYLDIRTWAWRQNIDDAYAKFTLVALAQFADNAGTCFPSHRRLAEMTGLSASTIKRKLIWLVNAGLVETYERRRRTDDGRTSNLYKLLAGDAVDDDDRGDAVVVAPTAQTMTATRVDHSDQPAQATVAHQELVRENLLEEPAAASDDANAVAADGDTMGADMSQEEMFSAGDVDPEAEQRLHDRDVVRQRNKRAQDLTKRYTSRVPLAKFPAVLAVVKRALEAGYDDDSVAAALDDLIDRGRSVTVDSLRIALDNLPPMPTSRKRGPCPCCAEQSGGDLRDCCQPCFEAYMRRARCDHDPEQFS